jgi:hypothetical protein
VNGPEQWFIVGDEVRIHDEARRQEARVVNGLPYRDTEPVSCIDQG